MKTSIHKISIILQYTIAAFLAITTLGAFTLSFLSGVLMLLATLLACPFTRNKEIGLINKMSKGKIPIDKIKGWMYGIVVFILFAAAVPKSSETNTVHIDKQDNTVESTTQPTPSEKQETIESSTEKESSEPIESSAVEEVEPSESIEDSSANISNVEVHFIDVGQGDATLIKADDHYMLIDVGDNSKGTTVQLYLKKQGVEKLDYLILTHTDADHIGGTDVIITKFNVDTVFIGDFKKDNKTYEELMNVLDYKGLKYSIPSVGDEYKLGNATFTIVAPNKTYSDPNNSSIALVLTNGDNSFLFTGDCEEEAENDILANGLNIDCDVYKVGHHGSRASSSITFLKAVTPTYGVISCAEGNSYGYPHAETLNNFREMGVQVFRTDEQGSIIAASDGTNITWNCSPSDTWKAGESTQKSENNSNNTSNTAPVSNTEPTEESTVNDEASETQNTITYICNTNTKKFHYPSCSSVKQMSEKNKKTVTTTRDELIKQGYEPCKRCNP